MISVFKYAFSTVGPQLTVPWLASRIVLQSLTYGMIVFGKLLIARRLVLRDRHLAEEHLDLRQDALGDRLMRHRKRRRMRRMAMDDGVDVGPILVDRQVQQHFAGPLARAGELLAFVIDLADVLGLQEALGHHRRRAEDFPLVEPDGDIAVVGGGEALGVKPPADLADLFFDLVSLTFIGSPPRSGGPWQLLHSHGLHFHGSRLRPRTHLVDRDPDTRTIRIDRLLRWAGTAHRLHAFADADLLPVARAEFVEDDEVLAVGPAIPAAPSG